MPRLADQQGPIADADDARERLVELVELVELVDAATLRYLGYGYGSPVLLVHTATAPNAVLHVLPALPRPLWAPSLAAVWAASAAITATYAPAVARDERPPAPAGADDVIEQAVAHGDEHVIKFADTAVEVYQRTGNPDALAAAAHSGS